MCPLRLNLPLQEVHHLSDGADLALVLQRVGQNEAVQLFHVGVDGVQRGLLSTA